MFPKFDMYCAAIFTIALATQTAVAQQANGPSFSCANVTSAVNKLICASPELSTLDHELSSVFGNMRGQPLDQKKLRADEDAWLAGMRQECHDAPCIERKYRERLAALRDESLRAAGPAAYEETRPFPAPVALLSQAQDLIGKTCAYQPDVAGQVLPGFAAAPGFLPVVMADGTTVVRERDRVLFAFLTDSPAGTSACVIRDVAVLPAGTSAGRFLQCSNADPEMSGFGVRDLKSRALLAFWSVDKDTHKFERVPMSVLGIEKSIRCHQPETGE